MNIEKAFVVTVGADLYPPMTAVIKTPTVVAVVVSKVPDRYVRRGMTSIANKNLFVTESLSEYSSNYSIINLDSF